MAVKLSPQSLMQLPLLEGLSEATLKELSDVMRLHIYAKGAYVMHKGSLGEDLFFLLQGRLLVMDVAEDGRQIGLNFLSPGDFFGELAMIDELPRSASIMAVGPSLVGVLSKAKAKQLFFENPLVAERMLQHMGARLRGSTDFRAILGIPHAAQRVFALLKLLAKPDPGKLLTIEMMPTHAHLALMTNTSRETVSRSINFLIEKCIVEKDNRRLIIRDPQQLEALLAVTEPAVLASVGKQ